MIRYSMWTCSGFRVEEGSSCKSNMALRQSTKTPACFLQTKKTWTTNRPGFLLSTTTLQHYSTVMPFSMINCVPVVWCV